MAQIDANATKEQIAQMEREFARKRATAERRRELELARLSAEQTMVDRDGTVWNYVVIDGSFARVISCKTEKANLVMPEFLDGYRVREIGPEAFSRISSVRTIVCARSIARIGPYAFRACENLASLILPDAVSEFSAGWVSLCPKIEHLQLPAALEVVGPEVVSNRAVRSLVIGESTKGVQPGAFEKTALDSVTVVPSNRFLQTDGTCIYTADGSEVLALVREVDSYSIQAGCKRVAKKAFANAKKLRRVVLPDGVTSIGELAFANSALEAFDCPATLVAIKDKAFLRCQSLRSIQLNEGLTAIGDEVFAGSALESLHIPSSVSEIGRSISGRTPIRYGGAAVTFSVSPDNPSFFCDGEGGLYRRAPDGVHFFEMLDPGAVAYSVKQGAVAVDEKAFAYHANIEEVSLPEGLRSVGAGAFRVCARLRRVEIPDSIESVGDEAFIDTVIEGFRVPRKLVHVGQRVLVTEGSHHEGAPPALQSIEVDEQNPVFFMHAGMLCRRTGSGVNAVMFTNSCSRVDFPGDLEEVEDYAFNNAFGIEALHLNARLRTIGACGLSVWSPIRLVRIDVAQPIEGRTSFVLRFPDSTYSAHGFLLALGGLGHLYLPDIMAQYDNCIAAARDYHSPGNSDNASAYDQVKLIIERLNDAVLLTESNRKRYCDLLTRNIEEICVDVARHDDRTTILNLVELGFLNAENIEPVTIAVAKLQDAAMSGYLLELQRMRFKRRFTDFDL